MFIFLLDETYGPECLLVYDWKTMHLPNTVHLSLLIGQLNDLFILLDTQLFPVLDHLCITFIERMEHNLQNNTQLTSITSRLCSLKLSYMSFDDLLTFLSLVHMPSLEKLILIEIYDNSKCKNWLVFI